LYTHLLVALDPESSSDAPLKSGVRLAKEYGATLRVMSVVRPSLLSAKGFFHAEVIDRERVLSQAKDALRSRMAGVTSDEVGLHVLVGSPGELAANVAERYGCDLIVMGARPRSRSEAIFGTTATSILKEAGSTDIYACHRADPQEPVERIVIAVDGSNLTEQVLSEAVNLLRGSVTASEPEVRIVCVVEDGGDVGPMINRFESQVAASGLADRPLQVLEGNLLGSLDAIVRDFDADLLIIGAGKNFGLTWFVGSTTNDVLHEAPCDVLVIRGDD
jgi:universal stress protein A